MPRRDHTIAQTMNRVERLCAAFDTYLERFEELELFTGPSVCFHLRTLHVLRMHGSAAEAAADSSFAEMLYATLTAWGLHRMGRTRTKLLPFEEFSSSLREARDAIRDIERYRLLALHQGQVNHAVSGVWRIMERLRLGASNTKLVVNSKAVHHLLPALVPPVDREYTLTFFFGHKNLSRGEEETFKEMFPLFHRIGVSCAELIRQAVGRGFHTSETKVIDNAIVGFVSKEMKP